MASIGIGIDDVVLSEDRLKQISRSIRSFLPSADADLNRQIKDFKLLLDRVFHTSSIPSLSVTHRVAAWNTLCSLIDQSLESPIPEVREVVWDDDVWNDAFELYLQHGQNARPKSSRQLLATLTNALRKSSERDLGEVKESAATRLASALLDYEDPPSAKVSAQLLSQLLQKDVLDISRVFAAFPQDHTPQSRSSDADRLLGVLFKWLGHGDFGSTIAHLVSITLDRLGDPTQNARGEPLWTAPLLDAFAQGAVNIDDLRAHVLPALLNRNFADFVSFLKSQGLDSSKVSDSAAKEANEGFLYAALQTGKELGLLEDTDDHDVSETDKTLRIPLHLVKDLLFRTSRSARITGLYLLVISHSATKPFSRKALRLIQRGLDVVFADVDADFRGDVLGAFQKLVDRLRSVTATLARQNGAQNGTRGTKQTQDPAIAEKLLSSHQEFLEWLPRFLCWQLRPTASYQRHISALKCLTALAKSGLDEQVPRELLAKSAVGATKWPFHVKVASSEMQRLLLDLVLDPFDDVRQTSSDILTLVYSQSGEDFQRYLDTTLKRAETMMLATGRADHADGVAHLYALENRLPSGSISGSSVSTQLLEKLEQMLRTAEGSLAEAVAKYPIHGLLTSLRYVMGKVQQSEDSDLHHRLCDDLHQIWMVVKPVLCNDAPEGYSPDELEEGFDSTKETLSYCWRALKEASLLMSTLITSPQIQEDDLLRISDLCFTQLAELRHRGAFSTVAQTWITCCMQCKDLESQTGMPMLTSWYTKVLSMLRRNVTINTRRSAGIPSLLCGILIADKSSKLLASAIADLETIARHPVDPSSAEEGSLPQVHAMNCLKDILKNSRLGEQSERYVPAALHLAADALRSDFWAVRNCGLMLFRAVIDRLLGTDQSHFDDEYASQKHVSAHQHPQLIDVILGLLPKPREAQLNSTSRFEGVFPALQLLQHTQVPEHRLAQVKLAVEKLTASPSWHVRDKAARSLAALMARMQHKKALTDIYGFVMRSVTSSNGLHGALLTALYYFHRRKRTIQRSDVATSPSTELEVQQLEHLEASFLDDVWTISSGTHCFIIKSAALDVLGASDDMQSCREEPLPAQDLNHTLQSFSLQSIDGPTHAALRQAVARLMAQRVAAEENAQDESVSSCVEWVLDLARVDQNACEYFLKVLKPSQDGTRGSTGQFIYLICAEILKSDLSVHLKSEAQDLLLALPSKDWPLLPSLPLPDNDKDPHDPRPYLVEPGCNQRHADRWLQIRAMHLDNSAANFPEDSTNALTNIVSWVDDCVAAIDGEGTHTREAAALAIDHLNHLWRLLINDLYRDQFIRLCMIAYDLLNDDDEDTRLRAANMTRRILAAESLDNVQDMEPITAGRQLLTFCATKWPSSCIIADTAFKRAFNMSFTWNRTLLTPLSVAEQLKALSHSDTALFVEEKQNLYVDEAREVRVWSQVVPKLQEIAIPRQSIERLAAWVLAGIDTFAGHAEQHPNGALGWSSKADVFKLALQVVYGAEMLLALARTGIRLPVRPSELKRRLFVCAGAWEKGDVSCLLQWEINRVLSESVVHKVALVHDRIMKIRWSNP